MKLIIQYVQNAKVEVDENIVGQIGRGYAVLVGFGVGDSQENLDHMAKKLLSLRTIPDDKDQINLSIKDIDGQILLIPQFTLYADTSRGHRPSFSSASPPDQATLLFDQFVDEIKQSGLKVETGIFGAHMHLSLTNNGPITISLEN